MFTTIQIDRQIDKAQTPQHILYQYLYYKDYQIKYAEDPLIIFVKLTSNGRRLRLTKPIYRDERIVFTEATRNRFRDKFNTRSPIQLIVIWKGHHHAQKNGHSKLYFRGAFFVSLLFSLKKGLRRNKMITQNTISSSVPYIHITFMHILKDHLHQQ